MISNIWARLSRRGPRHRPHVPASSFRLPALHLFVYQYVNRTSLSVSHHDLQPGPLFASEPLLSGSG